MIKKSTLLSLFLICVIRVIAQDREAIDRATDSITAEGKALYRSEWTSWYGTDIFTDKCRNMRPLSGGYFSYETDSKFINIFYSKGDAPQVIATITFDKDYNAEKYNLDTTKRVFSTTETEYFKLKDAAVKHAVKDTMFKSYQNSSLNFIPFIWKGEKKVYVLTGPNVNGVVIFGNDYLFNFNNANEIKSVKRLHKNIIPIYTKADSTGQTAQSTMHSHLPETGDYITATDICTLMLYEHLTTWQQHYVISKNDVSIWDCKKNILVILTMEAWKRIGNDQETRHPKKE